MNLYEIDATLMRCFITDDNDVIDTETGEVFDASYLESLQMERSKKIRNIACWIKNLRSDADQLKAEEQRLKKRRDAANNKADALEKYLKNALQGEKITEPEFAISWRKSEAVVIDDQSKLLEDFLKYKDPEPDKVKIKAAIKDGRFVDGAHIEQNMSMTIK